MPTIDELAPRELRSKLIDLQLDPNGEAPSANKPITLLVSYERTLPAGVMRPLVFEVQGPSARSYQRREYVRTKPPATIIFTPREGGRHTLVVREVAHNLAFGSLAIEVAGERFEDEPER